MSVRRINYYQLSILRQRLEEIPPEDGGPVSFDDLPREVTDAPWFEQREYFQNVLELAYCVRCKLPIPNNWASDGGTDICHDHYKQNQEAWERVRERRRLIPLHRGVNVRGQVKYQRRLAKRQREEEIRLDVQDTMSRLAIEQTHNTTPAFDVDKMLDRMKKKN